MIVIWLVALFMMIVGCIDFVETGRAMNAGSQEQANVIGVSATVWITAGLVTLAMGAGFSAVLGALK